MPADVAVGKRVLVQPDTSPGKSYPALVVEIGPSAGVGSTAAAAAAVADTGGSANKQKKEDKDVVVLDANHPLAGQNLNFLLGVCNVAREKTRGHRT